MAVTCTAGGTSDLDTIALLWEKLRAHHRERSPHFAAQLASVTWDTRKKQLLEKCAGGSLRLDIVRDSAMVVGYCIATVDAGKGAELDSIYLEDAYRRQGIGTVLLEKALAWMDAAGAVRRVIGVMAGNEDVLPFYRRFGFEVRTIVMEQVSKPET